MARIAEDGLRLGCVLCSPRRGWQRRPVSSSMGCSGRSGARPAGCGPRRRATQGHGGSRRSSVAAAGKRTCCAISCAIMRWRRWPMRTRCWCSTKRAFSSRARRPAVWRASTPARRARSPTARSGSLRPTSRGTAMPSSTAPSTCRRPGPVIGPAWPWRMCHRRWALLPARKGTPQGVKPQLAGRMVERAIAAGVPFAWVAGDSVYGVGELEMALRRTGKGYVLGVNATQPFNSWIGKPEVAGTAEEIAQGLDPTAWRRLSAGEGCKGPRLYDWAYLELADLAADEYRKGATGTWTRGLLIRRSLADGKCAYFATWCPAGTTIETLAAVEGQRWAIEDAFETAKNELGLDHNESRSWHGWHRHVSLVMLAFAMLAVIRHQANVPPPKTLIELTRRTSSAGRSRRSVASPSASPSNASNPLTSSLGHSGDARTKPPHSART